MNRREEMMQLLGRRELQGLTFKALAQESGVPAGTLAFWAWKLRQEPRPREPAADQRSGFVELVPASGRLEADPEAAQNVTVTSRPPGHLGPERDDRVHESTRRDDAVADAA